MMIETARIRFKNAAFRYLRELDDRGTFDGKLFNILRGIWLDNGVDAVNEFVRDQLLHIGIGDPLPFGDFGAAIPVVRTDFADADFENTSRQC